MNSPSQAAPPRPRAPTIACATVATLTSPTTSQATTSRPRTGRVDARSPVRASSSGALRRRVADALGVALVSAPLEAAVGQSALDLLACHGESG